MRKAVIEDWDAFTAFLAAQPFCVEAAQKQREIASRGIPSNGHGVIQPPPKKNDNADLVAALASMA